MNITTSHAVPSPAVTTNQTLSPLAFDDRGAGRLMGLSPRSVWALRKSGQLPYRRVGRRCLISLAAINAFLAGAEGGAK